jgi:hypothetical protein
MDETCFNTMDTWATRPATARLVLIAFLNLLSELHILFYKTSD